MNLHEYQSKRLFAQHGVPVPQGGIADTSAQARHVAGEIGLPVAVKAQVLVGGRGKAGGIHLADTLEQVGEVADELLHSAIKGFAVRTLLVERAAAIQKELYLGVVIDRAGGCPAVMVSAQGGVDIEQVAQASPEAVTRVAIDPFLGLRAYQTTALAKSLELAPDHWRPFDGIVRGLTSAFSEADARLAEINPLVLTTDGSLLALDGKMVLDDNALFRHTELAAMRDADAETAAEQAARQAGMSYVQLEGNIGCLVNGAGLAMATMDTIKYAGGAPANFLDIGGGARADTVTAALRLMLGAPGIRAALVNIFGGITRCDEVARGIVAALEEIGTDIPMVVRLVGTNEAEGRAILESLGRHMLTATSLSEAAHRAVAAARGQAQA